MGESDANEYLVVSRGMWDADASPDAIQAAIDRFYDWLDAHVAAGRMRRGSRLTPEIALVTRPRAVTDGPFAEVKELIGGYWFVIAPSLQAAAQLLSDSPTVQMGIYYEVRPLDPERANARIHSSETPGREPVA